MQIELPFSLLTTTRSRRWPSNVRSEQLKIAYPVIGARDGIEALQLLRGQNGHAKGSHPHTWCCWIRHMPRMGGIEFLEELRCRSVAIADPVFVMTTSEAEQDRMRRL